MKRPVVLFLIAAVCAPAQTSPRMVAPVLEPPLQTPELTSYQLRRYLLAKVPPLPAPASAEQWTAEAERLRRTVLSRHVFAGWPREWIEMPLRMEDLGPIPGGKGYRMRKLRYQVMPGFHNTAILYEPENLQGKAPAVLNTNGHVGAEGKAVEYKQKRCINQALRGMIALNVEWPGMGELSQPENAHSFHAHLDVAGASGLGFFYLTVRRALDYLWDHPHVDRTRIGITGLSGGGFQSILLGSLDERIRAAVPVSGFAAATSRVERVMDTGDIEHHPSDLLAALDYPLWVALRAPRPTLLMYSAEDDCCYRAPLLKPYIYDRIRPFFRLYGKQEALQWHMNTDPSTHNYGVDHRQQMYRFFGHHFNLPESAAEIPVDSQIKRAEELAVGLPAGNLTILGLARKLAARIERPAIPAPGPERSRWAEAEQRKLRDLLRFRDAEIEHAWPIRNTHDKGLETVSYRFDFTNGLSCTGSWLKAIPAPGDAPATLILSDQGKKAAAADVSDRVNRGEQVLAADLVLVGDMTPRDRGPSTYAQLLAGLGDRALGLQAAQLLGAGRWLRAMSGGRPVRLETSGMRSQAAALAAAALDPKLFSEIVTRDGLASLSELLDRPVEYQSAPELFCLDLLKEFDLDRLKALWRN